MITKPAMVTLLVLLALGNVPKITNASLSPILLPDIKISTVAMSWYGLNTTVLVLNIKLISPNRDEKILHILYTDIFL